MHSPSYEVPEESAAGGSSSLARSPTTRITAHLSKYAYTPQSSPRTSGARVTPGRQSPRVGSKRQRIRTAEEDVDSSFQLIADKSPTSSSSSPKMEHKSVPPLNNALSPPPRKIPRPYAPPETYSHLYGIGDHLAPDLRVVFCGINPGKMSATMGAHYANPSNRFWKMLHLGGFTPDRVYRPQEDKDMPKLFRIGLTNLVERVTSEQSELSGLEMRLATPAFLDKLQKWQPAAVVMVGRKIWDEVEKVLKRSVGESGQRPAAMRMEATDVPIKPEDETKDDKHIVSVALRETSRSKLPVELDNAERNAPLFNLKPGKAAFVWAQPRPYKLVHREATSEQREKVTLFWVVPSTSGLERTLMHDRVTHAVEINTEIQRLEAGEIDLTAFLPIQVAEVPAVVRDMERKAARLQAQKVK